MAEKFLCELVSSESVYALAYTLASEIRASGFRPDLVVAISRGGFTPARVLCDALGIFNLTSIRILHYKRAATKNGAATVKYPLCIPVNGLRLLVVDDVNDSGDTLREARKHLETLGPKELRTAVLQEKAGSTVCADYVAESVGIAAGFLIAALHHAGLVSLTHTPSPMGFLNELLCRPSHERPFLLLAVGYPADDATVPSITKKALQEIVSRT